VEYLKNSLQDKNVMYLQYKYLIEEAYNLSQSDQAQSDISSFEAHKILQKLKDLEFTSSQAQLV
jgi:hypothetical protein